MCNHNFQTCDSTFNQNQTCYHNFNHNFRNNQTKNPSYIFGSSIITLVIGSLAFITALAWNSYIQQTFHEFTNKSEELQAKLSYAVLITAVAIVLGFFVMYFIDGDKW